MSELNPAPDRNSGKITTSDGLKLLQLARQEAESARSRNSPAADARPLAAH